MVLKNLDKTSIHKVHEKEATGPSNKVVAMSSASVSALDGRQASIDDCFIILAKLNDVHDGKAYLEDWSDDKVANDLCVPRNWVTRLREQFGGDDVNEQSTWFAEAAKVITEIKTKHTAIEELVAQSGAYLAQAMQLEGRLESLKRSNHDRQH